jgi:quinol monooxygenase YgiN
VNDASTFVQSIHYTFEPADADLAETMLRELRDASREEPGVVAFDVARSREVPNVFALWEVYADRAAVDAHAATPHFQRLVIDGIRKIARERIAQSGHLI